MKPTFYLSILVRLFAIVLALVGLHQLEIVVQVLLEGYTLTSPVVIFFANTILPFVIAVFLWRFPLTIAKKIVPPNLDQDVEPMNTKSWLSVFLVSLGAFALFYSLVDAAYYLLYWGLWSGGDTYQSAPFLTNENKANMIVTGFEIVASLAIILRANTLASYILRKVQ